MLPKISIITACYNSEKHIEQTIRSVREQTYSNIEYVIVDGASADRTMEIVEMNSDCIDVIISESDKGIYDAFNKGVKQATGDIIYFLNSDDYLYDADVVRKVAQAFIDNGLQTTMVVYGDILKQHDEIGTKQRFGMNADLELLKEGKMPPHPGMFVKRELFSKYQYFDMRYRIASDFDFVVKLFKGHIPNSVRLHEIIAVFRMGGASTQLLNRKQTRKETVSIIQSHFDECRLQEYSQEEYNQLFYNKWLEIRLFRQQPASTILLDRGIRNLAVFGSLETAAFALRDLHPCGIHVHAFLDNDIKRQGFEIHGVPIHHPSWLKQNRSSIDAVLFALGGDYEEALKAQIAELATPDALTCISWREMIAWNFDA